MSRKITCTESKNKGEYVYNQRSYYQQTNVQNLYKIDIIISYWKFQQKFVQNRNRENHDSPNTFKSYRRSFGIIIKQLRYLKVRKGIGLMAMNEDSENGVSLLMYSYLFYITGNYISIITFLMTRTKRDRILTFRQTFLEFLKYFM